MVLDIFLLVIYKIIPILFHLVTLIQIICYGDDYFYGSFLAYYLFRIHIYLIKQQTIIILNHYHYFFS